MSLKTDVTPLVYFHKENTPTSFFAFKLISSDIQVSISEIKKVWDVFFPGQPVEYFFLDEFYNKQYKDDNQFKKIDGVWYFTSMRISPDLIGDLRFHRADMAEA